jgi:histidyl-tRNA synthetase
MLPDAEVLKVANEILSSLPIGPFTIKLNHRKLLDTALALAGVPPSKFRAVCSAIDKLDKEPWAAVRAELVEDKGLPNDVADAVGRLVQRSGAPLELLAALTAEGVFSALPSGSVALGELATVFRYLGCMGALGSITLDLSLARGLDYYTGLIYEAVLLDPTVGVGSIAAGGRYDGLVGMFSPTGAVVPCVGVSIGVERVFAIMEARAQKAAEAAAAAAAAAGGAPIARVGLPRTPVAVWVASIPSSRGRDMAVARLEVLAELWAAGFSAEALAAGGDPKLQKQLAAANDAGAPFAVVLGEDELDKGEVQVKDMAGKTAVNAPRGGIVAALEAMGAQRLQMGVTVSAEELAAQ